MKKVLLTALATVFVLSSFTMAASAYKTDDFLNLAKNHKCVDCDLSKANFPEHFSNITDLTNTNLSKAYLVGVDLTGANLSNVNLTRANLTGANLSGVNLTNANLTAANLTGVIGVTTADLQKFNVKLDDSTIMPSGKPYGKVAQ